MVKKKNRAQKLVLLLNALGATYGLVRLYIFVWNEIDCGEQLFSNGSCSHTALAAKLENHASYVKLFLSLPFSYFIPLSTNESMVEFQ